MTHLHEYETPPALCPYCGHFFDRATEVVSGEGIPKEGDITVCIGCASALVFGPKMALEKLSDEDYDTLRPDVKHSVCKTQAAIRLVQYLNPPEAKSEKGN